MDLVITIPQTSSFVSKTKEVCVGSHEVFLWKIAVKPKNLMIQDRVYFIEDGCISYYHTFTGFVSNPMCALITKLYRGLYLILDKRRHAVKPAIPMRSFQGVRYIDRIS